MTDDLSSIFLVSVPLDPGPVGAHPHLRKYDIFDAALKGTIT